MASLYRWSITTKSKNNTIPAATEVQIKRLTDAHVCLMHPYLLIIIWPLNNHPFGSLEITAPVQRKQYALSFPQVLSTELVLYLH